MTTTNFDVVGIGNAIVDVITRCEEDTLVELNVAKGRMQLIEAGDIDRIYRAMGPTVETSGGSTANTLAGLASLGAKAAFTGKVADDEFGRIFTHDLNAIGVHFKTLPAVAGGEPTARCLIFVTPDGERTMNTFLGVSPTLSVRELDDDLIASARVTYLEGYLFDRDDAKKAFVHAAAIASRNDRTVALSLSDPFCVDRHRAAFRMLVKDGVDLLFANEEELCSLYQASNIDDAIAEAEKEIAFAAITRSAEGCTIFRGGKRINVPAEKVSKVVDTTGAGDLYAAGFLFGFTRNLPLEVCGKLGGLAAAEVISHLGARPATPLQDLVRQKGMEI